MITWQMRDGQFYNGTYRAVWNGFTWKLFNDNLFVLSSENPLTIVKFVHTQQRRIRWPRKSQ